MKKRVRFAALLLTLLLSLSLFAGCSGGTTQESTSGAEPTEAADATEAVETSPEAESTQAPEAGEVQYPLEGENNELSLFMLFAESLSQYYDGPENSVFWPELEARTGVHIEFQLTNNENQLTNYNIMVASGDITDMIYSIDVYNTGSLDNAVENGILVYLDDYVETCMPDYLAAISQDETMSSAALTDSGHYACAKGFYDCIFYTSYGLCIRQDWLDDLNLEAPVTYDDWENVMEAFMVEKGAEYGCFVPYTGVLHGDYLAAGFGVKGFVKTSANVPVYQIDGEVKFGPIEEGFLDYLTLMNEWYEKGYLKQDLISYTAQYTYPDETDLANNSVGIFATMTTLWSRWEETCGEGARLSALADAVQNEGDMNHFSYCPALSSAGTAIGVSTNCENVELACKWLNYGFTEEGMLLNNYGIEGVSFEYVDGKPQLTDAVFNNPDGIPSAFAISYYAQSTLACTIVDHTRMDPSYTEPMLEAYDVWNSTTDGAWDYPFYATMNMEETDVMNELWGDIETFLSESIVAFIMGDKSLDEWDSYLQTLEEMGIQDVIDAYQSCYDRYIQR